MTLNEFAELIFPNEKDVEYYESLYPERENMSGSIVTRFAPSPTGFVHIGALEQCIVETALVKKTNGILILRIEDTDQKRKIENGVTGIIESMNQFDICFDEGMKNETDSYGSYGPYIQTQRGPIYRAYAKKLVREGKAYPCFATEEELKQIRQQQEKEKCNNIGYYGKWAKYRNLSIEEAANRIKSGEPYVIRFKSMGTEDGYITHKDMIKGKAELPQNILDIIIIKSDGLPTYHFAHAIDDHLMHITHIIRSNEWFPSVPLHLELFHSLGFKIPKYCHYAPMLKIDYKTDDNGDYVLDENGEKIPYKRKISKRKDPEAAVNFYHQLGIPKESVREYLMTIANSDFEMWRKSNPYADLYEFPFELKKMSNTEGALFDMDKLMDVSKNVIATFEADKVYSDVYSWACIYDEKLKELLSDEEYGKKVFSIERGRDIKKKRKDIGKWEDIKEYIIYMYDSPFIETGIIDEYPQMMDKETLKKIFSSYGEKYFDENDDNQTWFSKMKDLAEEVGYAREVKLWKQSPEAWPGHVGDVSMALRVAITGRTNTPDLWQIMQVLGRERIITRLHKAIECLS